jgi:hypothetical protein
MTDPTEKVIDLKDKTFQIATDSGLGELIEDISNIYNLTNFDSQSDIPIPIDKIKETSQTIMISGNPSEFLGTLTDMINDEETAFEFPFLLTGVHNTQGTTISEFTQLNSQQQKLQNKVVDINPELLGEAVGKANSLKRNVYIIAHTHPNIPDEERNKTLTKQLPQDIKDKYNIKDVGLNLSLQDLYQLISFQEALRGRISEDAKGYLSVLMYDGTFEAISEENGKFKRSAIHYY